MLKILLKKQMTELFRSYFYDTRKNQMRSKTATVAYFILFVCLMAGFLGGIFTYVSLSLCGPMAVSGMDWLYFSLMGLLSIFLGTFGSVFNTYSSLYLSKDNHLLLSLPIPVGIIMASRLLSVYLMGLIYASVVIVPAVIVYWITVSACPGVILGTLLLIFLISLFVLTLFCVLGWAVAKISVKLKNKRFIPVLIALLFIGGYYFCYFKAQTLIGALIANVSLYGSAIKEAAYPLYLFGQVGTGDIKAALLISVVILALFALVWRLISRSFFRIAASSGKTERKQQRQIVIKQGSLSAALGKKEFSRFFASPNYMLNCGLGTLLLPIGSVVLLWKGHAIFPVCNEIFPAQTGAVPVLLCTVFCLLASMNHMAAPSISLEGKSLWLLQSLPVTPWQILQAKLSVQLLLTGIPMLFCILCIALTAPCTLLQLTITGLLLLSYTLLFPLLDLFWGLKLPNLSWTNEITPIKQSAAVGIALLCSFLYAGLLFAGFLLFSSWKLDTVGYMGCFIAATLILSTVLYTWLKKKGTALFAAL